jgi:hypothetical protein
MVDRDDIIKMAREAGLLPIDIGPTIETWQMRRKEESLVRFAELVAAHEREACAKACEQIANELSNCPPSFEGTNAETKWIRAMGETIGKPFVEAIRARI